MHKLLGLSASATEICASEGNLGRNLDQRSEVKAQLSVIGYQLMVRGAVKELRIARRGG
jgi:hypothetical protein